MNGTPRRWIATALAPLVLIIGVIQPGATYATSGRVPQAMVCTATYTVQQGDTLSAIAAACGLSAEAIVEVNNLSDPQAIVPGEVLVLPTNTTASSDTRGWQTHYRGRRALWRRHHRNGEQTAPPPTASGASWPSQTSATPVATLAQTTADGEAAAVPTTGTPLAQPATTVADAVGSVSTLLTAQAQAAGVDPALVKAIAWQESGWRMVTAADGGIGIMQLMPTTVTWIESALLGGTIDAYNASDNVRAGAVLLHYYLTLLHDERLAIAAYHQGLHSIQTQGINVATQSYVANVLALQQHYAA